MRFFFTIGMFVVFLGVSAAVQAQEELFLPAEQVEPMALGEVASEPHCFNVVNKAPYTVYGSINTNYFIRADGIKTRHKSNFRLETQQNAEFCTFGPFYEDKKVELVLRTLIPIFNCKTGIDQDIVIYGRNKSGGGTETYAACL